MERTYHFKNSQIRVLFGDITQCNTDVIVSSDDCFISMGGGVSGMIRRCAGDTIFNDINKHVPVRLGDVIVTSAGKLSSKYIFHVVTIDFNRADHRNDATPNIKQFIIENSINKCFRLLSSLELTSIAFPAIGAGVAGIPYEEVASHMIRAIAANLQRTNKAIKVELYLFDRYNKMTEWDFLPFFEKIGRYLPETNQTEEAAPECENKIDTASENAPFVFISYSRKDEEQAQIVCEILTKNGIAYWIDKEGEYSGSNFKGIIVGQIRRSAVTLFLSSQNSNLSPNVIKEIGIAVHYSKPIIPIKLDSYSYDINIEYDLCNIDYIEYNSDNAFEKNLIDSIRGYM